MNPVVIQLTPDAIQQMLAQAATLGAHTALRNAGVPIKEFYTRAELSRKFGRGRIDKLLEQHLLCPHRMSDGRILYLLSEVESHIV